MPITKPKGNVYAIFSISESLIVSAYDEGKDVTPDEFIDRYRHYFNLGESYLTVFDESRANGCRLFMTAQDSSLKLCATGIFIPKGLSESEGLQTLTDEFRMKVRNFDRAIEAAG
jgi:hypothetical protein